MPFQKLDNSAPGWEPFLKLDEVERFERPDRLQGIQNQGPIPKGWD
jgi:hypothetical protein